VNFTNEELDAVHSCLYDEAYYGNDEVVYGNGEYAVNLRTALAKVEDEAERRKLWG
jgi:hypothetical protein